MVSDILEFKIKEAETLEQIEYREMVRLEVLIKNEEVAVKEIEDNAAKDKALEELNARVQRYKDQIGDREKSIKIISAYIDDLKNQQKKK